METLYYDGQCPLCSAEMSRLDSHKSANLKLVDIHEVELDEETKRSMLKVLHLESEDGSFRTGLEANIAAWEHTRWSFAWQWLRVPVIRWLAGIVYNRWAETRYDRLYRSRSTSRTMKTGVR